MAPALSRPRASVRRFEFNRVYGPSSTQEDVFRDTEPLMTSVLDGFNVCVLAYGQSGSGKTFTMEGTVDEPGLTLRAVERLFELAAERRAQGYESNLTLGMIEIYNEGLRDLIAQVPPMRAATHCARARRAARAALARASGRASERASKAPPAVARRVVSALPEHTAQKSRQELRTLAAPCRHHRAARCLRATRSPWPPRRPRRALTCIRACQCAVDRRVAPLPSSRSRRTRRSACTCMAARLSSWTALRACASLCSSVSTVAQPPATRGCSLGACPPRLRARVCVGAPGDHRCREALQAGGDVWTPSARVALALATGPSVRPGAGCAVHARAAPSPVRP